MTTTTIDEEDIPALGDREPDERSEQREGAQGP